MNYRVLLAAVAGAAATGFLLWVVARRSSLRPHSGPPLAELARRYRNWEIAGVALAALAILACWGGLGWAAGRVPAAEASDVFRLTPHPIYLAVAALFLGNLVATGPTHFLYVWLLGERFPEFRSYQTRKFGFDAVRWMIPFYVVFGCLTAGGIALLFDWYTILGPQGLRTSDLPGFGERVYSYQQLLEIRVAPRTETATGAIEERTSLVLSFDNHTRWSSEQAPAHVGGARYREIAEYVAEVSGLPLVEVAVLGPAEL